MSFDAKRDFEKDPQKVALIPSDERIEAVIRAMPKGSAAGQSFGPQMRLGAAGALIGAAARKLSEQGERDVSSGLSTRWPSDALLYWLVLTDRALHVFRTTKQQPRSLDASGARFGFDEIERLEIGQSFMVKPMRFDFTDGSAITVDCAAGIKADDFIAGAGRAFAAGVSRGAKDTSGFWIWAWLGIFGLLLGALATGVGATTEQGAGTTILSIVAAVCAVLGTSWWIVRWSRAQWKWWGVALTLLIVGAIVTAASFDKESCDCVGAISLGAPFGLTGLAALIGRIARRS